MSTATGAEPAAPEQPAPEARVIDATELDVEAHAALQQRVFGGILEENGIPLERLGPAVFAWKLAPPAGPARLAIVERGGELLSSCTAFPVELGRGEERVRGWHLCDAVTAPEARGQGLFGAVLDALGDGLPAEDWLFAFPNGQSRRAFEKRAYRTLQKVPLWFRPVGGRPRASERVRPIAELGAEHDAFAERLAAERGLAAVRSAAYLRWRYLAHPYFDYQLLELRRDEGLAGLLVLNRMEARGRVSLWVMELLALDGAARKELALTARALGKAQGCDVLLAASSGKLPGALRVPPCFLPKQHVLMVRGAGDAERPRYNACGASYRSAMDMEPAPPAVVAPPVLTIPMLERENARAA